jgi:hypothetical protein
MKKFKYNYLAFLSEEEIVKHPIIEDFDLEESNLKNQKESQKFFIEKRYVNRTNYFVCSCGDSFQVDINFSTTYKNGFYYEEYSPNKILCKKCNETKSLENEVIKMSSSLGQNLFKRRYAFFEDENFIQLVEFKTYKGLNIKCKKLYETVRKRKLIYNKSTNRFYIYDKANKGIKLKSLNINIENKILIDFIMVTDFSKRVCDNLLYTKKHKPDSYDENIPKIFRNEYEDYYKPIFCFMNRLKSFINKKDINRLEGFLESETFYKNNRTEFSKHDQTFKCLEKCNEDLSIIISILQYPYLANLLFTKKKDFYISFLKDIVPYSYLKKKSPTSPKEILLENILQTHNYSRKSILEQIKFAKEDNSFNYDNILEVYKKNKEYCKILKSIKLENSIFKKEDINNFNLYKFYINCLAKEYVDKSWFFKEFNKNHNKLYTFFVELLLYIENMQPFYYVENSFSEILNSNEIDITERSEFLKKSYKQVQKLDFIVWDTYLDTIDFAKRRNYDLNDFFKLTNWKKIVDLHDELYLLIRLEKIEKFNEGISSLSEKYKSINETIIDNIRFKLIDNISLLELESKEMNHCVRSYAQKMSEHKNLIFSIKDLDNGDRATLEFFNSNLESSKDIKKDFWTFNQLKAKFNTKTTQKIIDATIKFTEKTLKEKGILYEINKNKNDLSINKNEKQDDIVMYNNILGHELNELDDLLPF